MIHVKIPESITLRSYQQEPWNAFFNDGIKNIMLIEHRRAGKDDFCINLLAAAAIMEPGYYIYLFPEHKQARKVIWDGITKDGTRFIDRIPQKIISKKWSIDMKVELINGSMIQILGSNNYDSLVGTNPKGIIFSEYALQDPRARQYMLPVLAENDGWQVVQSTPRGMNHAYELWCRIQDSPRWFTKKLTVEDTFRHDGTPVVTKQYIKDQIEEGMPDELVQSEYYCDFEAAVLGAYYSSQLKKAYNDKRIGEFKPNPKFPVFVSFDLGYEDSTAMWFVQVINHKFYFIHYYENNRLITDHYFQYAIDWSRKNQLKIGKLIVPHDIARHDQDTGKTRLSKALNNFGPIFTVAPKLKYVIDGIELAKKGFKDCYFDQIECHRGLTALTEYHAEWVSERNVFRKDPYHNWASHGADAFRYWFQFYSKEAIQTPEVFISEGYRMAF